MTTGQFLIERPCAVEQGQEPSPEPLVPYPVWVILPAADPPNYLNEKCDGLHYKLTRDSARQMGCDFTAPWVCEHMGRLIE